MGLRKTCKSDPELFWLRLSPSPPDLERPMLVMNARVFGVVIAVVSVEWNRLLLNGGCFGARGRALSFNGRLRQACFGSGYDRPLR